MKFFGREIPPAPTAGKDNKIEQSAQTPNPEVNNPEVDLDVDLKTDLDASNTDKVDTPADPSRRDFLKNLRKVGILYAGATIMPETVFGDSEDDQKAEIGKRQKIGTAPKERIPYNQIKTNKFIEGGATLALNPYSEINSDPTLNLKRFIDKKDFPKNFARMERIFEEIEQSQPGKMEELRQLARDNGFDFSVIYAMGVVESSWNKYIKDGTASDAEVGLAQLKYGSARHVGYTGPRGSKRNLTGLYDPATNLEWVIKYIGLAMLKSQEKSNGGIHDMLQRYNQGPWFDTVKNLHRTPKGPDRAKFYADKAQIALYYYYQWKDGKIPDTGLYGENTEVPEPNSGTIEEIQEMFGGVKAIIDRIVQSQKESQEQKNRGGFSMFNIYLKKAEQNNIHPHLLLAVAAANSGWQFDQSINSNGTIGFMGVDPDVAYQTGLRYTNKDMERPLANVRASMRSLSYILENETGGDLYSGLKEYGKNDPGFTERVMALLHHIKKDPQLKDIHWEQTKK